MANTSFNFNVEPYYDDFEEPNGPREQNYMRVLFRPGYAVQARELTQLQTILQNQIKQFGDHIFQDGSPVQGGHITFDNSVKSLKLQPQYQNNDIDLDDFNNKVVGNTATGSSVIRAKVLAVDPTLVRPTIVFKYLTGNQFTNNQEIQVMEDATKATSNALAATSNASIVGINEGIFYVDGYFAYVPAQTIIVDAYNDKPTAKIGLQIVDGVIDETTDESLLDPAQKSFNYQAPGATRYQFKLELTKRTLESTDDSKFFELIRIENGEVTKQVNYPIYPNIEKVLARRTFDESGHYTVKPFRASTGEHPTDSESFRVNIEPGKAYVSGYEFQTFGTVSVDVEKARTKNTSTDYSLSLDYGNYVLATNVYSGGVGGFPKILTGSNKDVTELDLHLVSSADIDTSAAANYANTKIGTAKFRNIDYAGTVSGTPQYYFYLYDVELSPQIVAPAAISLNNFYINLPTTFSSVNDAYKGVKIRINSGTGADSYTRTITAYDGATKNATVDIAFSAIPDTTTQATLVYTTQDIDSIVAEPGSFGPDVYYNQDPASADYFCCDISADGKTPTGRTTLYDSGRNKLYYSLPQQYVANGTSAFSKVEYYFRHSQSKSVSSGSVAPDLVSGATWPYGDGNLSPTTALSNFIVINNDNGELLDLSPEGIINITGSSLSIDVSGFSPPPTTVTVISTQKYNSGTTATKALITADSQILASHSTSGASAVVGTSSGVLIKPSVGQVWFVNPSYINKIPGQEQSLYLTDVVRLLKVYDSGDPATPPSVANSIDITNRYVLNSGQKDSYYDYASIILKGGQPAPRGQLLVLLEYYSQSGSPYVTSASYSETAYSSNKIPKYTSLNRTVELRDCIDFRPRRTSALLDDPATTFKLEGAVVPAPEYFLETTYNYYVPRRDRLILTKDKEFKLIKGIPSSNPVYPLVSEDGMILYNVNIPAYTSKLSDVGLEYLENKRYTMRDIGLIEKRIENLEYYTSLSILELQAKNESILYEDNVFEKEKYGIVVDDFSDFSVADVYSPELLVNISKARLGPFRYQKAIDVKIEAASNVVRRDKVYSLAYTEQACVVQSAATKGVSVQPYQFAEFQGTVRLTPESDYWYNTNLLPDIIGPVPVESPGDEPPIDSGTPSAPPTNLYWYGFDGYGIIGNYGGWFLNRWGYDPARYSSYINSYYDLTVYQQQIAGTST